MRSPVKKYCLPLALGLILAFSVAFAGNPRHAQIIADLEQKASEGDSSALYHLSTLYERGFDSIPADAVRSFALLRQSALRGYAPAQNYLGFLYYADSLRLDKDSAIYWLEKAAAQNDMKAANNLAFILLDSTASPEQEAHAVSLLSRAAEAGLPSAIDRLGDLYRTGRSVTADTTKASMLYLEATRRGAPDAEKKLLAMMYPRYSSLSPQEALNEGLVAAAAGADVVAFTLFNRAAQDSIPRAYALLGDAYAGAKGTDYNNSMAIDNYLKAALGGDPSAQFILAELLEIFPDILNGHEIPLPSPNPDISSSAQFPTEIPTFEDLSSPHYWYSRAASSGVTDADSASRLLFTPIQHFE